MAPFSNKVSTYKIYLSGLPDGLKPDDLRALFEPYGRIVECEVFKKNYAFVHMEEAECGRKAIQALNKKEVQGKTISVCESKNTEGPNIATTKLSVKNLPFGISPQRVRSLFQKFGLVLECETFKGEAIVHLEATGDIRTAINEMNGFILDDKTLKVEAVKVNLKAGFGPPAGGGSQDWSPNPVPFGGGRGGPRGRGSALLRGAGRGRGGGGPPVPRYPQAYGGGGGGYEPQDDYYEDDGYGQGQAPGSYYPEQEFYEDDYGHPPPPLSMRGGRGGLRGFGRGGGPVLRNPTGYNDDNHFYGPGFAPPSMRGGRGGMRGRGGPLLGGPGPRFMSGFGEGFEEPYYEEPSYFGGGPRFQPLVPPTPRRKLNKGEPYPAPPAPHPSTLGLGIRPRGGGAGGPVFGRPKSRGERGGVNRLTAGKKAIAQALIARGVRLPRDETMLARSLHEAGYHPPGSQPRGPAPVIPNLINMAMGGQARNQYMASTRGRPGPPSHFSDPDPFAPSAAEKRVMMQHGQAAGHSQSNIDFTADIMLS